MIPAANVKIHNLARTNGVPSQFVVDWNMTHTSSSSGVAWHTIHIDRIIGMLSIERDDDIPVFDDQPVGTCDIWFRGEQSLNSDWEYSHEVKFGPDGSCLPGELTIDVEHKRIILS